MVFGDHDHGNTQFGAEAVVSIAQNAFHVTGKVTEVKKLGKISDAFKAGAAGRFGTKMAR